MADFTHRCTQVEQGLGLGILLTYTEIAALAGISPTKMLAVLADGSLGFPKPVYENNRLRLYAKADVDQWLQGHDLKAVKPDWDNYRTRCFRAPDARFGEGKLYRDTRRFYTLLDRVNERQKA